jgi:hypothetical protein
MRFKGKSPSSVDKQVDVYNFTIGKSELFILVDLLKRAHKGTPKSFLTGAFRNRVQSMEREIQHLFREEGITYTQNPAAAPLIRGPKELF